MTTGVEALGKFVKNFNYPFSKSPLSAGKIIFLEKKNPKQIQYFSPMEMTDLQKRQNVESVATANIIPKESVSYLQNRYNQKASLG